MAAEAVRDASPLTDAEADARPEDGTALPEVIEAEAEAVAIASTTEELESEASVADALSADREAVAFSVLVSMEENTESELSVEMSVVSGILAVTTLEADTFCVAPKATHA
jgi:hypothetical protein